MLHELPRFELFEPSTLDEAVEILHGHEKVKVLAGGTDLLGLMKDRIAGATMPLPEALVDIRGIPELRLVSHSDSDSSIGAAVTLTEIASDQVVVKRHPALAQAAAEVGTEQIKNMGTIGGNLCQRPWCWYFRHPAYDCFKKGGRQCYAITGDNSTYFSVFDLGVCVMAHPSDTAPALIALDATAEILGRQGLRFVPMEDFFLGPRERRDHVVGDDELLVRVRVPNSSKRSVYLKQRPRNNWDFALASAAASGVLEGAVLSSVKVVLGGVAPRPYKLEALDDMLAGGLTEPARAKIRARVLENARPLKLNRYKLRMVTSLVLRALASISSSEANN